MTSSMWISSPTFFVSFSFVVGVLNFLDTFARLMYSYMVHARYPLEVYLKPAFFLAQAVALIMFLISVRSARDSVVANPKLSRFFAAHTVLIVVVILLYVDFQVTALVGMPSAYAFLQLAFSLVYLFALSGTCFWFASELHKRSKWKWGSMVFVLIGLAFTTAFLEPMLFWSQNYASLVFPSQLALIATFAPHILMFLAAMSSVAFVLWKASARKFPFSSRLILFLFVPALLLPLVWNGYKEGLINLVIGDVFYYGLGYTGKWYSVSFYLMSVVAYIFTWKELSRRLPRTLASSLIVLGVASLPWNGVTLIEVGYSSIPGNVISLSSIITGATLLMNGSEMK